jgi:hypothetical protein
MEERDEVFSKEMKYFGKISNISKRDGLFQKERKY